MKLSHCTVKVNLSNSKRLSCKDDYFIQCAILFILYFAVLMLYFHPATVLALDLQLLITVQLLKVKQVWDS